ncbi:glycosyltransferase [Ilyomonas limi]|uniref:Glycosyltransferase n=1 Tax=Ilyomonas limi TaxID=2575867 RepID=A0A4V5UV81_9BACT|nr:glycosyltransferase [Ilyomonas limi]TKK72033.1 glycosyltransferase [Ilyomonas limi]
MYNLPGVHSFSEVSLLITHCNRSRSLERLLQAFKNLQCSFGEIVVSDDGSKPEHLAYIQQLQHTYVFTLVTTPVNKGLGNNINKGQDAVSLPYTLYVQEDFEPSEQFAQAFGDALYIMQQRNDIDIVRLYAYFSYPYKKPFGNGFSKMKFHAAPWYTNHLKFYVYSDHPHLRRSDFLEKFGRYAEGVKGDITEYRMAVSFIKHKGKGLFYDDFTKVFYQRNSAAEPSTMNRSNWRESQKPVLLMIRAIYLKFKLLKCTFDLALSK